ncbi:uncharacterized protein [Nicotiana tomentosiformis]|uniref:uncharacterized protein n=1 Tax=Nicotiana tomentosiformis TaxID=4098 RepID=UPI00388CD121
MNEDLNTHLMDFDDIMNTFQYNEVSKDDVYLRAFPSSLKDDMKQWVRSLPAGSIRTWEDMTKTFLDKYFSTAKTGKFRRKVHNFYQKKTETDFWDGLTPSSRRTLNTACGGPIMKKMPEEVVLILDELSEDANQWPTESNDRRKSVRVHQADSNTSMQAQLDTMAKEIRKLTLAKAETSVEKESEEQKVQSSGLRKEIKESRHMPALPFPQKMKREKLDKCFGQFLEMLKQLYVNIPFTEVLTQMPAYAKFLKEILSSKRKLEEATVVKLNAHCSSILQNKIPQKKLEGELGMIKSIPLYLQMADQTTILPEGIIEDILVWVDKFVCAVDFIVGRPFLCTGRAILDIYEGQLMLRVGNKNVVFQMKRIMKYSSDEM